MSSPRALALDFGRVLTLDPDKSTFSTILARWGISALEFSQAWGVPRHDYDRGSLDAWGFWKQVCQACLPGTSDAEISAMLPELVDADFTSWAAPRVPLHALIQRALDQGVPTAIVSNMPKGLGDRFVAAWPWLGRIPHRFFSAEIGLVKPDDEFYHHVLQQTGWSPNHVLFVDDLQANVDTAARLGFETLLFTGHQADLDRIAKWCRL